MYMYGGILFSHEKEGNPSICNNMDEAWGHILSEILQIKTNSVRSHLYVESKNAKLLEECLLFEGGGGWGGIGRKT